jgi:hypothetical protein
MDSKEQLHYGGRDIISAITCWLMHQFNIQNVRTSPRFMPTPIIPPTLTPNPNRHLSAQMYIPDKWVQWLEGKIWWSPTSWIAIVANWPSNFYSDCISTAPMMLLLPTFNLHTTGPRRALMWTINGQEMNFQGKIYFLTCFIQLIILTIHLFLPPL